jgi:predicted nucleic acid-binding protein
MITAVDTNILLDILAPNPDCGAIEPSANTCPLVICDLVYAELCIHFGSQREGDEFLQSIETRMQPLRREALSSPAAPGEPIANGEVKAIGFWRIF